MARFMNKLMVLGVAAAMAMPGIGFAGGAPQVNTNSPMGMTMPGVQMPVNMDMLNGLGGLAAGGLANMNLSQMLTTMITSAITPLMTQLMGQIGGIAGQVAGGMIGQQLGGLMSGGGASIGGIGTGGLTSVFGGIQGGTDSMLGSIGGSLISSGLQQVLGGIQGGSGGSSDGSSSGGTSLGGITIGGNSGSITDDKPILNANAPIDPTNVNYQAGLLDAARGNGPDPTFIITIVASTNTIVWDSNYWTAYQKALVAIN